MMRHEDRVELDAGFEYSASMQSHGEKYHAANPFRTVPIPRHDSDGSTRMTLDRYGHQLPG